MRAPDRAGVFSPNHVLYLFSRRRYRLRMPRDGSRILSDLQSPTVSIVCESCGRRKSCAVAKLIDEHGAAAKLSDLLCGS